MPRPVAIPAANSVLPDYWIPGKDAAFLHFLLRNPDEMLTKYGGNQLHHKNFFSDREWWVIFRLMQSIFVEQGTISLGVLAGEIDEAIAKDPGGFDLLGERYLPYLETIARFECSEVNYEEWRENHQGDLSSEGEAGESISK